MKPQPAIIALALTGSLLLAQKPATNVVKKSETITTNQPAKSAVAPEAPKPKFTKQQVQRRLRELQDLYERGLLTKEFYERKVKECEVD